LREGWRKRAPIRNADTQGPDMCRGIRFDSAMLDRGPIELTIDEDAALALRTELERFLTQ